MWCSLVANSSDCLKDQIFEFAQYYQKNCKNKKELINRLNDIIRQIDPVERRRYKLLYEDKSLIPDKSVLLSIVVSCSDNDFCLPRTLDSILCREYNFSYEVVCIGHNPTAEIKQVLDNYQKKYKNLFVVKSCNHVPIFRRSVKVNRKFPKHIANPPRMKHIINS